MTNPRSRGGCWTCRQKRRKCDETKPSCNICQARGIPCGGYELRLAEFRAQGNYDGQMICRIVRGSAPDRKPARYRKKQSNGNQKSKARQEQEFVAPESLPSAKSREVARHETSPSTEWANGPGVVGGATLEPTPSPNMPKPLHKPVNASFESPAGTTTRNLESQEIAAPQLEEQCGGDHGQENKAPCQNTSITSYSPHNFINEHLDPIDLPRFDVEHDFDDIEPFGNNWFGSEINPFQLDDTAQIFLPDDVDIFSAKSPSIPFRRLKKPASVSLPFSNLPDSFSALQNIIDNDACDITYLDAMKGAEDPSPHEIEEEMNEGDVSDGEGTSGEDDSEAMEAFTAFEELHPETKGQNIYQSYEESPTRANPQKVMQRDDHEISPEKPSKSLGPSDFSSPFDSYLYSHYFSVLAPSLYPVAPDRNPYKLVYGKMASSCLPLRAAILEASARHLSSMGQLPPGVVTLYRDSSWETFKNAVVTWKQSATLAATLLLSILVEFVGTGTDKWTSKLCRARRLLVEHVSSSPLQSAPNAVSFLRLQYNWMAAIGRVMQNATKGIEDLEQLDFIEDDPQSEEAFCHVQERWFSNMPDYKYFCYFKEATFLARRASSSHNNQALRRLIPDVADLLQHVAAWQPEHSAVCAPYSEHTAQVSEVWRQGLICYIYADICALSSSDSRIQGCVRRGSEALQDLDWIQSITWPMFMLGVHAILPAHRQILETSYIALSTTLHFAGPRSIINFLQKVWTDMDSDETGDSKWRVIMEDIGIQINVVL